MCCFPEEISTMDQPLRSCQLVPKGLVVEQTTREDGFVRIWVRAASPTGICPSCGTISRRVHSRYLCRPSDLPLAGHDGCKARWRRFGGSIDPATSAESAPGQYLPVGGSKPSRHAVPITGRLATLAGHKAIKGVQIAARSPLLEIGGCLHRRQLPGHGSDDELVEGRSISDRVPMRSLIAMVKCLSFCGSLCGPGSRVLSAVAARDAAY